MRPTPGETSIRAGPACFGGRQYLQLHATKVFNTIEGGAVAFQEDWMDHRLNCLKNFGIVDQDHVVWVGGNAKMNEFQAAMGLCNLRHVDGGDFKAPSGGGAVHGEPLRALGVKAPPLPGRAKPNYAYFPVVFDGFSRTGTRCTTGLRPTRFTRGSILPADERIPVLRGTVLLRGYPGGKIHRGPGADTAAVRGLRPGGCGPDLPGDTELA